MILKEFTLKKKIGSGAYGLVYLAEDCFQHEFAIKVISCKSNNTNYTKEKPSLVVQRQIDEIFAQHNGFVFENVQQLDLKNVCLYGSKLKYLKEIAMHLKVNSHPNVVTIHKIYKYKEFLFIVMDYYKSGDLFNTIVEKKMFINDAQLIKRIFLQLLDVVQYCHEMGVYHCDIKPENILMSDDYQNVFITDFGLAIEDKMVTESLCCGSSYYMAPERLQKDCQSSHQSSKFFPTGAGDIWSLGIILINLTCIRNPWMKASLDDHTFEIFQRKNEVLYKILPISKELLIILIKYFLVEDANKRYANGVMQFELLKRLIVKCKSFTKNGPLKNCAINKSGSESDVSVGSKRSYDSVSSTDSTLSSENSAINNDETSATSSCTSSKRSSWMDSNCSCCFIEYKKPKVAKHGSGNGNSLFDFKGSVL